MRKFPVIIDCDPGLDDAIAIATVLGSEQAQVKGLVTVSGNQGIDTVTANARNILDFLGHPEIPVIKGAAAPLFRTPAPATEGTNAISLPAAPAKGAILDINPIDFYEQALMQSEEKVTILAIGPLTNIATLLKAHEELKDKIEKIVVMGGANITADTKNYRTYTRTAGYNFYCDAEAAHMVFAAGVPTVMVGADITYENGLALLELQRMASTPRGNILAGLCRVMGEHYRKQGFPLCPVQDAVAAAYVIAPDAFTVEAKNITVDYTGHYSYGASYVDMRINAVCDRPTYWVSGCDRFAVAKAIVDSCIAL